MWRVSCGCSAYWQELSFLSELDLNVPFKVVRRVDAALEAAAHGALALVGGSSSTDGVSQLLWLALETLVRVGQACAGGMRRGACGAARSEVHIFALLRDCPRYAPVRGLLRSCRKEHPELRIRALAVASGPAVLPALPTEARLERGRVFSRRLRRMQLPPRGMRLGVEGRDAVDVAVVSGGLRGLGLRVARYLLVEGRARHVVMLSRSAPRRSDAAAVEEAIR